MTNLDSIFKSRDINLPTKVRLVEPMVFPAVMYGCESEESGDGKEGVSKGLWGDVCACNFDCGDGFQSAYVCK